ncbi:MAG: four helix bundle protein [Bacteroidota bacterium]
MDRRKYDLEERLIRFSVQIIKLVDILPNTKAGNSIGSQIVRSGTSPALNYGEAQGAESRKDFIHKLKIVLKELRETNVCLRIIEGAELCIDTELLSSLKSESVELISIIVKSIKTTEQK